MGRLVDLGYVNQMTDADSIIGNFGGAPKQMTIADFRNHLNDNDAEVLNDLAFYIDVNKASTLGSTRVDVGGNMHMRRLWEDSAIPCLMDANGNFCRLNRENCQYTTDGDYILESDGTIKSTYAHGDVMIILPQTYGRVQTITVGNNTWERLWLSLVPLPNGYIIPQQVVGKFKCSISSSKLRSLPGVVPAGSQTINGFFNYAQARSKNHGLANLDFRNHLLFHMMSKYAYRDAQNCKNSTDSNPVWGVGLDGSENSGGWAAQNGIKTGHTLTLGMEDNKIQILDTASNTCHGVNVLGFENPWGQYWEMVQGLCSVGSDVYNWRSNFMPTGTPTAESFANVEHVKLTRATSDNVCGMNIIASQNGQGVYMIPKQSLSGVSYGDYYWYAASGQLWLFGGSSGGGSNCGLADAASDDVWSYSSSDFSARLAFYGDVTEVSPQRFRELA